MVSVVAIFYCLKRSTASVEYYIGIMVIFSKEGIENDMQEIQESNTRQSYSSSSTNSIQSRESSPAAHNKSRVAVIADSDLKERLAALQRAFRTSSEQKVSLTFIERETD